jgi:hypothetical protein
MSCHIIGMPYIGSHILTDNTTKFNLCLHNFFQKDILYMYINMFGSAPLKIVHHLVSSRWNFYSDQIYTNIDFYET